MKEFSRVPLSEASIANIIKDAAIPRGSFYQYFEDKEDIFYFLLEEYSSTLNQRFRLILVKEDGDLIPTFIESYRMMLESIQNKEFRYFFKNAFLNMNYRIENTISKSISEERRNSRFAEVVKLVNKDLLNIQHEEELIHVVKIIRAVTFQNLIQVFALDLSMEESINNYTLDLNLIKKGVYKK